MLAKSGMCFVLLSSSGKSRKLHQMTGGKGTANRAAVLCGISIISCRRPAATTPWVATVAA
jgi:hypothetical protein